MKLKFMGIDLLPALIPILINAAEKILDTVIEGGTLNNEMVGVVKVAYFAAKEFEDNIVTNPDNEYTDELLAAFYTLAEDTAQEAGITLVLP